jgi:vacuolar-type H+-ATPase subunit E/Vma4
MDNLRGRVDKIEQEIKTISEDIARELIEIKKNVFLANFKHEAIFRESLKNNEITYEGYLDLLDNNNKFRKKLDEILQNPMLKERVSLAKQLNDSNDLPYKIYADDLDLIDQIEKAGGTLPEIAGLIVASLPFSERFFKYIQKYLDDKASN